MKPEAPEFTCIVPTWEYRPAKPREYYLYDGTWLKTNLAITAGEYWIGREVPVAEVALKEGPGWKPLAPPTPKFVVEKRPVAGWDVIGPSPNNSVYHLDTQEQADELCEAMNRILG